MVSASTHSKRGTSSRHFVTSLIASSAAAKRPVAPDANGSFDADQDRRSVTNILKG